MSPEGSPQPEFAPSLPPIPEDQWGEISAIARSEARQRVRQSIAACTQSDLYQSDELVRYAWNAEGDVAINQIPYTDRQKLLNELYRDGRCTMLDHAPGMVQLVLPEDRERFVMFQQQVGAVIDKLTLRLSPGSIINMDDFESAAAELGVLPEESAEQEQFGRIFTFSHRVVFDPEQDTVQLPDTPSQLQPEIDELPSSRRLTEQRRHASLAQRLGDVAGRNKLLDLRKNLAAQAVQATAETQNPVAASKPAESPTDSQPTPRALSRKQLRLQRRKANGGANDRKIAKAKAESSLPIPRHAEPGPTLELTDKPTPKKVLGSTIPKPSAPKPSDPRFSGEGAAPLLEWQGPGSYRPTSYAEGAQLAPSLERFSSEALAITLTERLEKYVATHYPDPRARNESHIFRKIVGIHYDFMTAYPLPRCRRAFQELLTRTGQLSRHGDLSVYVTMPPGVPYQAVQDMHDKLTGLELGAERVITELLDEGHKRVKEAALLHYAKHVAHLELPTSMKPAFITILRNNARLSSKQGFVYIFDTPEAKANWASRYNKRNTQIEDPYSPL